MSKRSLKKSNQHFQKALKKLPLGVTSNFRFWGEEDTIYIKKASGCRLWDLDDNEYIDYRLAYGPYILGYADERVDQAAREGMEIGGVLRLPLNSSTRWHKRFLRWFPPQSWCAIPTPVRRLSWLHFAWAGPSARETVMS